MKTIRDILSTEKELIRSLLTHNSTIGCKPLEKGGLRANCHEGK